MRLAQAQDEALKLLISDNEVSITPYSHLIWLGVGYCVGKGWAVYSGNDHYMVTTKGREEYERSQKRQAYEQ